MVSSVEDDNVSPPFPLAIRWPDWLWVAIRCTRVFWRHSKSCGRAHATSSDILATTQQLENQRPEPISPSGVPPKLLPTTGDNQSAFAGPIAFQPPTQTDSTSATAPTVEQQIQQLGAGVEELKGGVQQLATGEKELKSGLQDLASNLRVTTLDPEYQNWRVRILAWRNAAVRRATCHSIGAVLFVTQHGA